LTCEASSGIIGVRSFRKVLSRGDEFSRRNCVRDETVYSFGHGGARIHAGKGRRRTTFILLWSNGQRKQVINTGSDYLFFSENRTYQEESFCNQFVVYLIFFELSFLSR
jgi:hypothetical protein